MPKRIYVGKNCNIGRSFNFFQAKGGIYIGNYVEFATRVSLLTSNHDLYNQNISHHAPIKIGDYCWLGMNSTILKGVELGPRTIVANGAVVNRSYPDGFCVLAGIPARIVKFLDPS
ncbi:MAG: acyltransferase, partial [Muribaculum sp.]|nr:acyltransferase [Muribaculum sp.]